MQEDSNLIKAFNIERSKELYVMNMKKKEKNKKVQEFVNGFIIITFFVFFCFVMYRNIILSSKIEDLYEELEVMQLERDGYWVEVGELKLQLEKLKKKRID